MPADKIGPFEAHQLAKQLVKEAEESQDLEQKVAKLTEAVRCLTEVNAAVLAALELDYLEPKPLNVPEDEKDLLSLLSWWDGSSLENLRERWGATPIYNPRGFTAALDGLMRRGFVSLSESQSVTFTEAGRQAYQESQRRRPES